MGSKPEYVQLYVHANIQFNNFFHTDMDKKKLACQHSSFLKRSAQKCLLCLDAEKNFVSLKHDNGSVDSHGEAAREGRAGVSAPRARSVRVAARKHRRH